MLVSDDYRSDGFIVDKITNDHYYNAAAVARWSDYVKRRTRHLVGRLVRYGPSNEEPYEIFAVFFRGPEFTPIYELARASEEHIYANSTAVTFLQDSLGG